jgi:hypothetical protein
LQEVKKKKTKSDIDIRSHGSSRRENLLCHRPSLSSKVIIFHRQLPHLRHVDGTEKSIPNQDPKFSVQLICAFKKNGLLLGSEAVGSSNLPTKTLKEDK